MGGLPAGLTPNVYFEVGVWALCLRCKKPASSAVTGLQRFAYTFHTKYTGFFGGTGSHPLDRLAEVSLNHVAPLQFVQVIGIPLHHGAALLQVNGLVVHAGYPILGMG